MRTGGRPRGKKKSEEDLPVRKEAPSFGDEVAGGMGTPSILPRERTEGKGPVGRRGVPKAEFFGGVLLMGVAGGPSSD